jgi:hypothetical protein
LIRGSFDDVIHDSRFTIHEWVLPSDVAGTALVGIDLAMAVHRR